MQPLSNLCTFQLLHLLDGCKIVDSSVLNDGQEDKQEARPQVDVYGFDVRHLWHGGWDASDDGGHGQNCGDAWMRTDNNTSYFSSRMYMSGGLKEQKNHLIQGKPNKLSLCFVFSWREELS